MLLYGELYWDGDRAKWLLRTVAESEPQTLDIPQSSGYLVALSHISKDGWEYKGMIEGDRILVAKQRNWYLV